MAFMPIYGMPLRLLPPEVVGAGSGLINFGGQFAGAVTPVIMARLRTPSPSEPPSPFCCSASRSPS
jgi:hypothetical protein